MVIIDCKVSIIEIYPDKGLDKEYALKLVFKDKSNAFLYLNFPFGEERGVKFKMPKHEIEVNITLEKNSCVGAKGSFKLSQHTIENNTDEYRRMVVLTLIENTRKSLFEGKFPHSSFRILFLFKFPHTHWGGCLHSSASQSLLPTNLDKAYELSLSIAKLKMKKLKVKPRSSSITCILQAASKQAKKNKGNEVTMTNYLKIKKKKEGILSKNSSYISENSECIDIKSPRSCSDRADIKLLSCSNSFGRTHKNILQDNDEEMNRRNGIDKMKEIKDVYEVPSMKLLTNLKDLAKMIKLNFEKILNDIDDQTQSQIVDASRSDSKKKPSTSSTKPSKLAIIQETKENIEKYYEFHESYLKASAIVLQRKKELKSEYNKHRNKFEEMLKKNDQFLYYDEIDNDEELVHFEKIKVKGLKKVCELSSLTLNTSLNLISSMDPKSCEEEIKDKVSTQKHSKQEVKRLLLSVLIRSIDKVRYSRYQLSLLEYLADKYQFVFNDCEIEKDKALFKHEEPKETLTKPQTVTCTKLTTPRPEKKPVLEDERVEISRVFDKEINRLLKSYPNIEIGEIERISPNVYKFGGQEYKIIKEGKEYRVIFEKRLISIGNFLKLIFK